MKNKRRWIITGILPLLFLFLLKLPLWGHQDGFALMGITEPKIVKPAPNFSSLDLNGHTVNLKDFKGKPILLNFWATWCIPCTEELPAMQNLYNSLSEQNVQILAVSIDRGNADRIREYANKYKLTFPVLVDPNQKIRKKYYVMGLPTSYLIDPKGNLRGFISGARAWDNDLSRKVMLSLK